MDLRSELLLVLDALRIANIDYALRGGLAVVIHGHPRLTRDIDLLLREADVDAARTALGTVGFTLDSGLLHFDAGKPTERRLWRLTKASGQDYLTLDLLLVNAFLQDVWDTREQHALEGSVVQVVSRSGLAKMKRAAGRPQDLADLCALGLDREGR